MAQFIIPAATTTAAGVQSAADKTKLDSIAPGAEVNVTELPATATDDDVLTWDSDAGAWVAAAAQGGGGDGTTDLAIANRTGSALDVTSSTGTDATIPAADGTNAGLMRSVDFVKLGGVATGAEVNVNTDLSLPALTQTAISREIASSTGTNVIIPAADSVMHAGLMTAADKGQLDTTILDPSAWIRNLVGVGHSAEDVANTFDAYIPDRLQEFQLHASYLSNEVAYYHRVLYLALNNISDASVVPAIDPDNWREFSTHRIEGYGDIASSLNASTLLETVEIAAKTAGFAPVYYPLVLTTSNNFPQTILAISTDGELEALNDVTNVSFPSSDDLVAIVAASIPDGEDDALASITLIMRGRVNDTGSWTTIKSASGIIASGNSTGTVVLTAANDIDFDMNDTDVLTLEMGVITTGSDRAAGEIRFGLNELSLDISGVTEDRHVIAHGTGDDAGYITIEKSSDNSLTRILDLTSTPTYVGPLDQTRVQDEQAQADYDETDTTAPGYITGTLSADAVAADATQFDGNLGENDVNVQTALETIDGLMLGGGGSVSVVAYEAEMTQRTSFHSDAWVNPIQSIATTHINQGTFTTTLVSSAIRFDIPEDGIYQLDAAVRGDVGTTNGDNRYQLEARLMLDPADGGSNIEIGHAHQSYARGERGGLSLDLVSIDVPVTWDLDEDDQVFVEIRGLRESSGMSLTLDADMSIVKVGGAQGATGGTGAQGATGLAGQTGAAGAAGTNGTNGTNGDDGDDGDQGIQGIQGPTGPAGTVSAISDLPQDSATDGQAIVWSDTNTQWEPGTVSGGSGVTDLGTDTRNATSLDITSSTGTDVTIPSATTSLAGLESAADKTKLDGVETNATADQTAQEIKAGYEVNADTNAFSDANQTKLFGIATGAEVNVQPDLFESSSGNDAYVQNSPFAAATASNDRLKWSRLSYDANSLELVAPARLMGLAFTGFTFAATINAVDQLGEVFSGADLTHIAITQAKTPDMDWATFFNTNEIVQFTQPSQYQSYQITGAPTTVTTNTGYDIVQYPVVDYYITGFLTSGSAAVLTTTAVPGEARLLPDTLGTAGQVLTVNTGATAAEWATAASGSSTLLALTDTPSAFGTAGQVLATNSGATAAEWVDAAAGGSGGADLSIANRGTTTLDIASDSGDDATIPAATTSLTGLQTAADKTKLNGIETGAEVNDDTNITISSSASITVVQSSTGTNGTISAASSTASGVMSAAQATKLAGIDTGAETNDDTDITILHNASSVVVQSSTGSNDTIDAATATLAGAMTGADKTKLDGITPRASMTGIELRAITFEIVSGTPNNVDEIQTASGNDLSSLVLYVANEDAGIADSQIIVIREELEGSIVAGKTGEFIVTSRTVAAIGTDDARITFTGHLSAETSIDQGLNTFSIGSVGLDVRLHFLHKEAATAYVPSWGTANTPLGYDADGVLSEIDFPAELGAFTLGNDYSRDDIVRYQDVLYRALADITAASEVPPFSSTQWVALSSHIITDLGEVKDEAPAELRLADEATAAQAAADGVENIPLTGQDLKGHPQSLVFVNDSDEIEAREDNVEIKFDSSDSITVQLAAFNQSGNATFTLALQVEESTNSGTWVDVKSGGGTKSDTSAIEITLTNTSDVSFDLDDGDTLSLRYAYDVTAGTIPIGAITPAIVGGAISTLQVLFTGRSGTEHTLGFDSAGDLSFYESIGGAETVLIDADAANGPTYIGPTDLSGLDSDLTANEQASIRTKIGATSGSSLPSFTGTSPRQVLSVNNDTDAAEWTDPLTFTRPEGRQYNLVGRDSSTTDAGQVRISVSEGAVYISQELTPVNDFAEILGVGRVWDLEDDSNFHYYRTDSVTTTDETEYTVVTLSVTLLDSDGLLDLDNDDDVVLTTSQRELPDYTSADAGEVLTINSAGTALEWATASGGGGTDDQDADEVAVDATQFDGTGNLSSTDTDVQTALETIDGLTLGGGGAVSVVAYSATATARTSFSNASYENLTLITAANTHFNEGGFTVIRVGGDDRIVIPEDGIYIIQYSYYFDTDNDSSGGSNRLVPLGRLVYDDGTTDPIELCQPQTGYARGQYSSEASLTSINLYVTAELSEDDEVYGQVRIWRQNTGNDSDVQHTINITKVGGAAGADGIDGLVAVDRTYTFNKVASEPATPVAGDMYTNTFLGSTNVFVYQAATDPTYDWFALEDTTFQLTVNGTTVDCVKVNEFSAETAGEPTRIQLRLSNDITVDSSITHAETDSAATISLTNEIPNPLPEGQIIVGDQFGRLTAAAPAASMADQITNFTRPAGMWWTTNSVPQDSSASTQALEVNTAKGSLMNLSSDPAVEYSLMFRIQDSGDTGSVRQTLYLWSTDNDRWEAEDSTLETDITTLETGPYAPLAPVKLSSTHAGQFITGQALLVAQPSANGILDIATRQVNGSIITLYNGVSVTVVGTTELANFTNPATYGSRAAHSVFRYPTS